MLPLPHWDAFLDRAAEVTAETAAERAAAVRPDDVSDILFTSGTTGVSKGVMSTHRQSLSVARAWSQIGGVGIHDRYLVINPFFHTFGLKAGILACLVKGATIVPHPTFDVPSVMRRVDEERITMLPGAPAIYQTILDHPDLHRFDLSSLRLAVTGAATVPVEMIPPSGSSSSRNRYSTSSSSRRFRPLVRVSPSQITSPSRSIAIQIARSYGSGTSQAGVMPGPTANAPWYSFACGK